MVSVIIPAYNASKTITQTLESVFAQDYSPIEIIIVNDGSTDATESILANYGTKIKLISTPNKGVSHARNLGLSHARGEYIQFLDSDDLILPGKLTLQVKALQENDADVAYGNWQRFIQENKKILVTETVNQQITGDVEIALFTNFWCPPAVLLYSKRITNRLSWNENLPVIQDARYLLDAALAKGKFVYLPALMAQYRDGQQNSLSKRNDTAFVKDCVMNARDISQIWEADFGNNPLKKKAVIDVLRHGINRLTLLDNHTAQQAIDFLLQIEPNYIPEEKGLLRYISKLIGYKNAEGIARIKRKLLE
ncbi:glycosyltransferase family 2 protein [Pedobacter insulae]|uniref:Glycosyl transferase family 2 n=1 Tax=Pedobacter insulae TaxID=414048 RepID=A0A1I2VVI6_9SPHI|nr:glycosyltransferase [Pedobacter insulae]SFG93120.1 Glycosyl transferase family 2 [Pedobacter insulae]